MSSISHQSNLQSGTSGNHATLLDLPPELLLKILSQVQLFLIIPSLPDLILPLPDEHQARLVQIETSMLYFQ